MAYGLPGFQRGEATRPPSRLGLAVRGTLTLQFPAGPPCLADTLLFSLTRGGHCHNPECEALVRNRDGNQAPETGGAETPTRRGRGRHSTKTLALLF